MHILINDFINRTISIHVLGKIDKWLYMPKVQIVMLGLKVFELKHGKSCTWKSISSWRYAKPQAASWAIFNLVVHGSVDGTRARRWSSKLLLGISSYTKSRWIPLSSSSAQYPTNLTRFGCLITPNRFTSLIHSLCPWKLEMQNKEKTP